MAESQSFTKQKMDKTKQFGDDSPDINHHSSDVAVMIIIHLNKCNVSADVLTQKRGKPVVFHLENYLQMVDGPHLFACLQGIYHIHLYMCGWWFVVFVKPIHAWCICHNYVYKWGFLKWGIPKTMDFNTKMLYFWMISSTSPILGNLPFYDLHIV